MRVLVVEDDALLRRTLLMIVERGGHECVTAGSADEAGAAAAWEPEVVVVDYQLPDGDGLALAGALRRSSPSVRRVVLLSGHPFDGDLPDDVDTVLRKPVSARELLQALTPRERRS